MKNIFKILLAVGSLLSFSRVQAAVFGPDIHSQNTLQAGTTAYPQFLYIGSSASIPTAGFQTLNATSAIITGGNVLTSTTSRASVTTLIATSATITGMNVITSTITQLSVQTATFTSISMNNNKIVNLSTPTSNLDAVNLWSLQYVRGSTATIFQTVSAASATTSVTNVLTNYSVTRRLSNPMNIVFVHASIPCLVTGSVTGSSFTTLYVDGIDTTAGVFNSEIQLNVNGVGNGGNCGFHVSYSPADVLFHNYSIRMRTNSTSNTITLNNSNALGTLWTEEVLQ